MTLAISIEQFEKVKAPLCVPLPVLSRCQAERAQGNTVVSIMSVKSFKTMLDAYGEGRLFAKAPIETLQNVDRVTSQAWPH